MSDKRGQGERAREEDRARERAREEDRARERTERGPVSYTHLDVYKRQI